MTLAEGSKSYHSEAAVYECFSDAEDAPGKVAEYIVCAAKGKHVLDLGCGTGKFLPLIQESAASCCGLDASAEQLEIAKQKVPGVRLVCSSAEHMSLQSESFDVVIAAWVISTIQGIDRQFRALQEAERVTKRGGKIILIENDVGGEFEKLRGRFPDDTRTRRYNGWVEKMGYSAVENIETYFQFASTQEAKSVFASIWGSDVAARITGKQIAHDVVIFEKRVR